LFGALVWQTQNKGLELAKSAQRGASILLPEMLDWNVDVLAKAQAINCGTTGIESRRMHRQ